MDFVAGAIGGNRGKAGPCSWGAAPPGGVLCPGEWALVNVGFEESAQKWLGPGVSHGCLVQGGQGWLLGDSGSNAGWVQLAGSAGEAEGGSRSLPRPGGGWAGPAGWLGPGEDRGPGTEWTVTTGHFLEAMGRGGRPGRPHLRPPVSV